jgi:phosphotransacetylase
VIPQAILTEAEEDRLINAILGGECSDKEREIVLDWGKAIRYLQAAYHLVEEGKAKIEVVDGKVQVIGNDYKQAETMIEQCKESDTSPRNINPP